MILKCWVSSDIDNGGNEIAEMAAKDSPQMNMSSLNITCANFKAVFKSCIIKTWLENSSRMTS